MKLVGIDIGKFKHSFAIIDNDSGEVLVEPTFFSNNKEGFDQLIQKIKTYSQDNLLIGMEDTGHYHFNLLKYLLSKGYNVALINPMTTDLTRHHHNLKEEINVYSNRLQKSIDLVFPEFNSLFHSKYGIVYMNILRTFGSAEKIANADIRTIRKCFEINSQGRRISLTAKKLKEVAKISIGISSIADEIQIRHLICQIELINEQLAEIDKKIEEFSVESNSPITSIPGISHFSGTSILSEIGNICNYSKPSKIIKLAGVAPYEYESSQFRAQHTVITKKGSKYLRKTLYQIITPVIHHNEVFKAYYSLKRSQGKGHRCAQGHCVRKLLRIIYHLLKTGNKFDPALLR